MLLGDARRALHVDEHERHRSLRERARLRASVEPLGEEHGEVVEDELGQLARRSELPVRGETLVSDPAEERPQCGISFRSRLLDVDQLGTPLTPLELVLDPGDRRTRCDPAVALPVDADEDVALLEVRAVHLVRPMSASTELEPHRRQAQGPNRGLDRISLGRELAQSGRDEHPQPLIRRQDRSALGHVQSLTLPRPRSRREAALRLPRAPVAQWIEQRFPKPRAHVRFMPGASRPPKPVGRFE